MGRPTSLPARARKPNLTAAANRPTTPPSVGKGKSTGTGFRPASVGDRALQTPHWKEQHKQPRG